MQPRAYTPTHDSLSGLVLSPTRPEALVLFLHGYGANGADLMGIGQALAPHLPSVGFIAPDAPGQLPFGYNARAWFDLDADLRAEDLDKGAQGVRPLVARYISAVLHDFDLPTSKLMLVGFSQGGMMALEVAPRLEHDLGHVISLSGRLVGADRLANELTARPPIFLGHGTADQVVPFSSLEFSSQALRGAGLSVETAAYDGIGHGIPPQAIETIRDLALALTG